MTPVGDWLLFDLNVLTSGVLDIGGLISNLQIYTMGKSKPAVLVKKHPGRRNKSVGNLAELKVIRALVQRGIHPHCVSCRSTNRARDNKGIDLTNYDEEINGRMVDDIQVKSSARHVDYMKLLAGIDETPERFPVIIHEHVKKHESIFRVENHYAICYAVDYISLLAYREGFNAMYDSTRTTMEQHSKLIDLGLINEKGELL